MASAVFQGYEPPMNKTAHFNESLLAAAEGGSVAALRKILSFGGDPHCVNPLGRTPLHCAVLNNTFECVALLLPVSNTGAQDLAGWAPLHYAAEDPEMLASLALLLTATDPNLINFFSCTPLHIAAANGNHEGLHCLLAVCDPLQLDQDGHSALHFAATEGHAPCIELLLAVSDVNGLTLSGQTAFDCALELGHHACAQLIASFQHAQNEHRLLDDAMDSIHSSGGSHNNHGL